MKPSQVIALLGKLDQELLVATKIAVEEREMLLKFASTTRKESYAATFHGFPTLGSDLEDFIYKDDEYKREFRNRPAGYTSLASYFSSKREVLKLLVGGKMVQDRAADLLNREIDLQPEAEMSVHELEMYDDED